MRRIIGFTLFIMVSVFCSNEELDLPVSNITVKEYIDLDWETIAVFKNGAHLGATMGETEQSYYGLPWDISADSAGIVLTLFRPRTITMNNELAAYDWSGNPIWTVKDLPIHTTTGGICIIDSVVAAYVHRDGIHIKIFDRLSGSLLDDTKVELPMYDNGLIRSCYHLLYVNNSFIGTNRRTRPSLIFRDDEGNVNLAATERAFDGGCLSVYALAHSEDKVFVGEAGHFTSVQVFDTHGEIQDAISFGYERIKPDVLKHDNIGILITVPIEDMQFRNDSLWVLMGTSVFPTDSSELWITDLNTMEATVVPFNSAVHSFAVYENTIVISKTNVHYTKENTSIEEETELCVATIE